MTEVVLGEWRPVTFGFVVVWLQAAKVRAAAATTSAKRTDGWGADT
ncbi:MAG: hypothetical protein ACRDY2_13170 [Acidimicrobiales bacterium]